MLLAIAFAALRYQGQGPVLPPSCSPSFQATVLSVEECLQARDFAKAAEKYKLLPKMNIDVVWDDSKVPAAYKAQFRKASDEAFHMWKARFAGVKINRASKGDIRISFEPVLAKRPDTKLPAAHVSFWSEDPTGPRLDYIIGLKRGSPLRITEELDIFDDVAYCIGTYLGIADGAFDTYTMSNSDLPRTFRTSISVTEAKTVRDNLQAVFEIGKAIKEQRSITPTKADLFIDTMELTSEQAIQGERVEFHVQLNNRGDGPLSFSSFPDCGCTAVTPPDVIPPQGSKILTFAVDTTAFDHNTVKHVAISTNDPVKPVQMITLNVKVKPRYRVISPAGEIIVIPDGGMKYALYLIPASGTKLEPVSVTLEGGVVGTAKYQAWQGVLPDPERHEGPTPRRGYKITLDIKGVLATGVNPATLQIFTTSSEFPDIAYSFSVQKGIVVLPEELPMGEVGRVPKSLRMVVTRPRKPFKVLGISTNSKYIKAKAVPGDSTDTYSILVEYDGKAPAGELIASITIKTNDLKQSIIHVPVRANIQ